MSEIDKELEVVEFKREDETVDIFPSDILMNRGRTKINEKRKLLEKEYNYYNDKLIELDELLPKLQENKNRLELSIKRVEKDLNVIASELGISMAHRARVRPRSWDSTESTFPLPSEEP